MSTGLVDGSWGAFPRLIAHSDLYPPQSDTDLCFPLQTIRLWHTKKFPVLVPQLQVGSNACAINDENLNAPYGEYVDAIKRALCAVSKQSCQSYNVSL